MYRKDLCRLLTYFVMFNHDAVARIKRALRLSTMEGMGYGGMVGLGEYFTAAYAVALKASNAQMALMTSLPNLAGALAQAPSAALPRLFGNRKRVVMAFALLQGLMWLPMIAVGFLVKDHQAAWLIAFVVLYSAFGALTIPAWGSIMAEVGYSSQELFSLVKRQYRAEPIIQVNRTHKKLMDKHGVWEDTLSWKVLYSQRTSVERVFSRLKGQRSLNHITVRGLRKVTVHCYLALIAIQALAVQQP